MATNPRLVPDDLDDPPKCSPENPCDDCGMCDARRSVEHGEEEDQERSFGPRHVRVRLVGHECQHSDCLCTED